MLSKNFWNNKKVLVTGHTGFKGSWLLVFLKILGADVTGYALDPYTSRDNFVMNGMENYINQVIGDIRNFEMLKQVFRENNPEIVFHLAAQPLVIESYAEPKKTFDTNIGGTVNLLECCRQTNSVRTIVNVTSDKCYSDELSATGFTESSRLGGHDPYSSSKAGSEIVTEAYRSSFFSPEKFEEHGISLSSARAGNVIGGGDWSKNRLIPDCIRHLEKGSSINVRNPDSLRPWQYVLDPIGGYLLLAQKMYEEPGTYCESWNFGPEQESMITVEEIVDYAINYWGSGEWHTDDNKNKLHETKVLFLDATKAKTVLGWKPKYKISESLDLTIEWYKLYSSGNTLKFCQSEVENYLNMYNGIINNDN